MMGKGGYRLDREDSDTNKTTKEEVYIGPRNFSPNPWGDISPMLSAFTCLHYALLSIY